MQLRKLYHKRTVCQMIIYKCFVCCGIRASGETVTGVQLIEARRQLLNGFDGKSQPNGLSDRD